MAKVYIYADEDYRTIIDARYDGLPHVYLPVEIPDDVVTAYEALVQAERSFLSHIINTYGRSDLNDNVAEEWVAHYERLRSQSDADHPAGDESYVQR